MKFIKVILKGLGILILAFIAFAFWYRYTYSMEFVAPYEVNDPSFENKILIATQSSEYKDELVSSIIDSLSSRDVHIQVIDVSGLETFYNDQWDAVVLIHTWEYSIPPKPVGAFISENYDPEKMIVVTTSGSGEDQMEEVDAITGASRTNEIPIHRSAILRFLESTIEL